MPFICVSDGHEIWSFPSDIWDHRWWKGGINRQAGMTSAYIVGDLECRRQQGLAEARDGGTVSEHLELLPTETRRGPWLKQMDQVVIHTSWLCQKFPPNKSRGKLATSWFSECFKTRLYSGPFSQYCSTICFSYMFVFSSTSFAHQQAEVLTPCVLSFLCSESSSCLKLNLRLD